MLFYINDILQRVKFKLNIKYFIYKNIIIYLASILESYYLGSNVFMLRVRYKSNTYYIITSVCPIPNYIYIHIYIYTYIYIYIYIYIDIYI